MAVLACLMAAGPPETQRAWPVAPPLDRPAALAPPSPAPAPRPAPRAAAVTIAPTYAAPPRVLPVYVTPTPAWGWPGWCPPSG